MKGWCSFVQSPDPPSRPRRPLQAQLGGEFLQVTQFWAHQPAFPEQCRLLVTHEV